MSCKVGIVGAGFVGCAVKAGLANYYSIEVYDKYKSHLSTCDSLEELCNKSNKIFVCLPTPMLKNGSCNISIIINTIHEIDSYATSEHIIILKSTVPPGTTKILNEKCNNATVVFSPEFLTEINYIDDFKNQTRIIIGGPPSASSYIMTMFKKAFPAIPIIETSSDIAEMVKYTTNCLLATKVSFANEMKQICDMCNIDYNKVIEYVLYDQRIGSTHLSAPGQDGNLGFGGSCFPKDLNALINFAKDVDVRPLILKAVWEKNLEVRPEKDWEKLKGRAIS